MLGQNQPGNIDQLQKQFVEHCKKWDQVYGYNAVKLYPELAEVFDRYGY
jgi:hypothetical protein